MDNRYLGISNSLNTLETIGVYQGDYIKLEINLKDEQNNRVNSQGFDATIEVVDIYDENVVYLVKRGEVNNEETDVLVLDIPSDFTSNIPIGKYRYIVKINMPSGEQKIGKGFILIL